MKKIISLLISALIILAVILIYQYTVRQINENKMLKQVISRLEADSRIAQVLVTDIYRDEKTGKNLTTIKFLEYDIKNRPLSPRYFTFSGNIIQFQSLLIRFDDLYIKNKDLLRGRSAYLF